MLDNIDMDFWPVRSPPPPPPHWIFFSTSSLHLTVADMGRLLFILLHDWNYTSFMNDTIKLIHLEWLFVCVCTCVLCISNRMWVCVCVCDLSPVLSLFLFYFPININLENQSWLCVAVCHPSLTTVLDLYQTKSYKGRTGFPLWESKSSSLEVSALAKLICGTLRSSSKTHTTGLPVQHEESPMCLHGVSQLTCMWCGRPPAWTVR